MDFLEKIFSNATQEPTEDERFSRLVKRIISGNSSEINPNYLYELQSLCQTKENASKVMNALSHAIDEFCDSPTPIFKALKLILLLLKLSTQTFTPAAKNYLPEIQTIIHISFDKPGVPHVNTIHRYANLLYLHLSKNVPLPEMKIPPRPKPTNSQPQQQPPSQNQRQQQRVGHSNLNKNDEGSLFDSNDNASENKYEESGGFFSNFIDLGPKRHQQQQKQQQATQQTKGSQNQEGPRLPAVFASGGAFQGIRSRISQPLDYGYEDENEAGEQAGESLLNFNGDTNDQSNDLLVGAFDDIGNEPKSNNNDSINQTNFVFSGAEPASSNTQSTDLNAPFNPFGADGFNPTFPDVNDYQKDNTEDKPSNTYRRPFVASGPKPKFDPTKMKKKPKVVPNTVPQDNFDPFGTGSAANVFDNISKDSQTPPKKLSLAERFGQKQEPQKQEAQQKKPQQPSKNVFDLLGIQGSESDDGNEAETPTTTQNTPKNQPQKGSSNVFDALGDDFGSFETPAEDKKKVVSGEELFQPFGSTPQLQQELDQTNQQKNSSANVFDMLGEDAFTTPETEQKQPSQPTGSNDLFDSPDQTKQQSVQKNSSANVFDMLGDDAFTTPQSSAPKTQPEPPKDDLFEHFGSSSTQKTPLQQQDKSNDNSFEPFGSSSQKQQDKAKDDLFEPFGSSTAQQNQQQSKANDDLFEPFGSSSPQQQNQQQSKANDDLFEPFGSSSTQQQTKKEETKENTFQPFGSSDQNQKMQSTNSNNDLFEQIGSSDQQPIKQQSQKSSSNVFDMLDGIDDFSAPQASAKSSQLQPKNSTADDLFESFGSTQSAPQQQPQHQQNQNQNQPKNSSANVFDMLDDNTFGSNQPEAPKTMPQSSHNDLFEPFGSSTQNQQQTQTTNSKDDLFEQLGSTDQHPKMQATNSNNDLFEPFGSSTQNQQPKQTTNSNNDLFEQIGSSDQQPIKQQSQKSSSNVFDMLDGIDDFSAPQASAKSSQLQPKNSTADDLFESFGSTQSTPQQQPQHQQNQNQNQPKNSSANVFDMLDDNTFGSNQATAGSKSGTASNDLFDSFTPIPASSTPQNSANVFDLLDSPNTQNNTEPKSNQSNKSTNPYDIFG